MPEYDRYGDPIPDAQEIAEELRKRRIARIKLTIGALLAIAFVAMIPINRYRAYNYGTEMGLPVYKGYKAMKLGMTYEQMVSAAPDKDYLQETANGYEYYSSDLAIRFAQSRSVLIRVDEQGKIESVEFIYKFGSSGYFNHRPISAKKEKYEAVQAMTSLKEVEKKLGAGMQIYKSAGEQRYIWSNITYGEAILVTTDGDTVKAIEYTSPDTPAGTL